MKLFPKILLAALLPFIFIVLLNTFLSGEVIDEFSSTQFREDSESRLTNTEESLKRSLARIEEQLQLLSAIGALNNDNLPQSEVALQSLLFMNKAMVNISVINSRGEEWLRADKYPNTAQMELRHSYLTHPLFEKPTQTGKSYFGETRRYRDFPLPVATLSIPFRSQATGQTDGIIKALISLQPLQTLLESHLGQTSKIMLIETHKDAALLHADDTRDNYSSTEQSMVKRIRYSAKNAGVMEAEDGEGGVTFFWRKFNLYDEEFTLIYYQPNEASSQLGHMVQKYNLIFIPGGILIYLIFSLPLIRSIVTPLQTVTAKIRHMAEQYDLEQDDALNDANSNEVQQLESALSHFHQELDKYREKVDKYHDALKKNITSLEESNRERASIFGSMNDGLIVINSETEIQQVNPKFEQLTGRRRGSLLGQMVGTLFVGEENNNFYGQLGSDHILRHQSGEEVPVSLSGSLVQINDEGDFDNRVLVIHDMREFLEMENAKRVNQAKDDFLASMSHELRTPLTTIIGNCEFLAEQEQDSEKRKMLHSIEIAGRSQLALVNDILDMSKIESGKFTIDEAPFDLTSLIQDIEHIFSVRARDAGLKFIVHQNNHESFQLIGDGQRIGQILINLIGNAIKFTEKGSITLTTWSMSDHLYFSVEDTGIGIPAKMMKQLFHRFEQADQSISRRFGGSGLGLFISDGLAKLMGGSIDVTSTEGIGSKFQLTIPYYRSDIPAKQSDTSAKARSVLGKQFWGEVLIAEDTPELQLLERRILESMGATVSIAHNGREAVEMANSHHFDLILMDMQMPEMDGIEATQALRASDNPVPVVALTANVMQKHRNAFHEAGCNGFLAKPIDRQELAKHLREHLQSDNMEAAVAAATPTTAPEPLEQESADELVDDEMMELFIESTTLNRNNLIQALSEKAWEQVHKTAHSVKGSAASFGHAEISNMAKEVCDAIDDKQLEQAQKQTMDLIIAMGKALP